MRLKSMVVLSAAAVLALAPQAFAMGGGGHANFSPDAPNGSNSGTFTGTFNGKPVHGAFSGDSFTVLPAVEPLSAFAVGLGLVGARLLRRRRQ